MLSTDEVNSLAIKRNRIRHYFYLGSLLPIILISTILLSAHLKSLKNEMTAHTELLSNSMIEEKKLFLRNAVNRTIALIDELRSDHSKENLAYGLSLEQREQRVKDQAARYIRALRLGDYDGYIWVNHILNFEGGDNYAIRHIHPNLPETEGVFLSTETTDIEGNQPYKVELEGIKNHGELFFDYYFKKMNSDTIAHKLAFAKLYEPYNWVIATGNYLDDIDAFIKTETQKTKSLNDQQIVFFYSALAASLIIVFLIVVFFERYIQKIMLSYEAQIHTYTDQLETLSVTDQLTGLFNRVQLENVFQYEIHKANRYNKQFSIIILDLDTFKVINDTYGHQRGDRALQTIAKLIQNHVRAADTVGRWGGEEFLIVCPESNLKDTAHAAEKIRQTIADHPMETIGQVTASLGVGSFRIGESKESLFERTDQALYRAKKNGRNSVECEQPEKENTLS